MAPARPHTPSRRAQGRPRPGPAHHQDGCQDRGWRSAQSHSDADLLCSLADDVGHYLVDANDRDDQSEDSKSASSVMLSRRLGQHALVVVLRVTSLRFARSTQAMRSTNETAPNSRSIHVRTPRVTNSRKGSTFATRSANHQGVWAASVAVI